VYACVALQTPRRTATAHTDGTVRIHNGHYQTFMYGKLPDELERGQASGRASSCQTGPWLAPCVAIGALAVGLADDGASEAYMRRTYDGATEERHTVLTFAANASHFSRPIHRSVLRPGIFLTAQGETANHWFGVSEFNAVYIRYSEVVVVVVVYDMDRSFGVSPIVRP
jgi:hypothetical protein